MDQFSSINQAELCQEPEKCMISMWLVCLFSGLFVGVVSWYSPCRAGQRLLLAFHQPVDCKAQATRWQFGRRINESPTCWILLLGILLWFIYGLLTAPLCSFGVFKVQVCAMQFFTDPSSSPPPHPPNVFTLTQVHNGGWTQQVQQSANNSHVQQ